MLAARRPQQQRRRIDRAARHDERARASTRDASRPSRSISTASIRLPDGSVISRRARALVHSVTFGRASAGVTQQMSASLFACSLHGNELHVLQRTQPPGSPG